MAQSLRRLGAWLLVLGCAEPPAPTGPSLPDSWLQQVISEPTRFELLLSQTPRDGWIALHRHDAAAAWKAFSGPDPTVRRARSRAAWEVARMHEVLGSIHAAAETQYHHDLSAREESQETGSRFAALAADCNDEALSLEVLGERHHAHMAAQEARNPALLLAEATQPVRTEGQPVAHTFFDPCLHHTLAEIWDQRALEDLDATQWVEASAWTDGGLESTLFAAWVDRNDLRKALDSGSSPGAFAANSPATRALGLPDRVASDLQSARAEVRSLDEALDAWQARLALEAPEEGLALDSELGLFPRFRQEWLLARATLALEDKQPQEALVFLDLARDVAQRDVGPTNSPRLFALLAAARFEAGRHREALDALHPLAETFPEILGLRERLGDLTVLRALTRTGDSKEN